MKLFVENGYYHIYNRGVDKRVIFQDDQDYKVFLYYLKYYLSPQPTLAELLSSSVPAGVTPVGITATRIPESLYGKISLLTYCLMPNHFHLQVKQKEINGISKLVLKIATNYSMYFNKKYKRVGRLFQGVYRAVLIKDDNQLIHLSRYIHTNPFLTSLTSLAGVTPIRIEKYPYSSYGDYLGKRNSRWLNTLEVLSLFENAKNNKIFDYLSYKNFVDDYLNEKKQGNLEGLLLEDSEEE